PPISPSTSASTSSRSTASNRWLAPTSSLDGRSFALQEAGEPPLGSGHGEPRELLGPLPGHRGRRRGAGAALGTFANHRVEGDAKARHLMSQARERLPWLRVEPSPVLGG